MGSFEERSKMRRKSMMAVITVLLAAWGCEARDSVQAEEKGEATVTLNVTSPAFEDGAKIPAKYTADGANVSPPLNWQEIPEGAQSIVIIADDPDAPMGTWVHWLIWNIPAGEAGIRENVPSAEALANGAVQGTTSFNRVGYGGPAPPSGTHRYYFKVYAIDKQLDLAPEARKADVEKAMQGHILAQGQMMGRYSKQ